MPNLSPRVNLVLRSIVAALFGLGSSFAASAADTMAMLAEHRSTRPLYLRPSRDHLPLSRYWAPEEFDRLRETGSALGLAHVEASPLTRSSYHAREAAVAAGQGG